MAIKKSYYDELGVRTNATHSEIRRAYRQLMRTLHPDSNEGRVDTARITRVNEAWDVLSQISSRSAYDQSYEQMSEPVSGASQGPQFVHSNESARFPWRGMLICAVLGIVLVLFLHATAKPTEPGKPDQLLSAGSCVNIDDQLAVFEVMCSEPHEGVVRQLVATDRTCPTGSDPYRDRQGMGVACVVTE
jgi:molecular chaperone DnaJ